MGEFTAKLTGESDGHTISRSFAEQADAIRWLQGAGLKEFDDQAARGEIYSSDGEIIWTGSHLQTAERIQREQRQADHRLLGKLGVKGRY